MVRGFRLSVFAIAAWAAVSIPVAGRADEIPPSGEEPAPPVEWLKKPLRMMVMECTAADSDFLPHLERYLNSGRQRVENFFGRAFPDTFIVRVFPDRATMTAFWQAEWEMPDLQTECWMVASGTASTLSLLSPRAWKTDACEHDAADTVRTQMLIIHEMVHTFHGQLNSRPEFEGLDSIGWFLEGLAVFASGQLEGSYLASAHEADSLGTVPSQLEDAWSGKYRYGVSGSIVAYIDATYSRKTILELLPAVSESEILNKLATTEEKLLHDWRAWLGQ